MLSQRQNIVCAVTNSGINVCMYVCMKGSLPSGNEQLCILSDETILMNTIICDQYSFDHFATVDPVAYYQHIQTGT
jgi:hypothetical protein